MSSSINAAYPVAGSPTTQSVRDNFAAAKSEIEGLQAGVGIPQVRYLSMPGNVTVFTGKARWYPPQNISVTSIQASVDTAPVGSSIMITLKKNGSTVTTASIAAGANQGAAQAVSSTATSTDYYTIDVTQIGSTTPGADLVVSIKYVYQ